MHRLRPFLVVATLCVAVVIGCLAYRGSPGAAAVAKAIPSAVAPPPPDPALASTAPPPAVEPTGPAPVLPAASRQQSLSAEVDRLSRSADPVDAFAAYRIVTACLWARDHEVWMAHHILPADRALLPTAQAACGDLASDQIQSRLRWLERAALAGVHHAATEMLREGPDGLGVSTSSDIDAPENTQWKERVDAAVEAGVRTCDPESLDNRVARYESGPAGQQDRAKALTYWVAYEACRKRLAPSPVRILGNGDSVTRRMGATLDPAQIAAAVAAGQQMARAAQPLPGDR